MGATRAVRRLLLTASLGTDPRTGALRPPPARSLLSPIWDTCQQQVVSHDPAQLPAPASLPAQRPLTRLRKLPVAMAPAPQAQSGGNVPDRAANLTERSVGTVVHLALEELSARAILPEQVSDSDRQRWRAQLVRLGLWGDGLAAATAEVEQSVLTTLAAGGAGRWLLGSGHRQAHSEWALTSVDPEGAIRELVIDRSFIDAATGLRWLIDYKNSRPAPGQSLEDFLAGQGAAYREQLLRYRRALRELGPEPLRCALYFTALGHLHHLPELDLASLEQPHADV